MNDPSSSRDPAASHPPAPTPFVPGSTTLPGSLAPDGSEAILLLIDLSDDPRWAADAAIALADAWGRAGRRIVLADLHLEDPLLHERLGESNLDGIVDIFLYGASVARSARPPAGHDFFLIPAGTYTATPEDVVGHPRWNKLIAGFEEAGATLLVFVPGRMAGAERMAGWGAEAVVLGTADPERLAPFALPAIRAVLEPAAPPPPQPGSGGFAADDEAAGSLPPFGSGALAAEDATGFRVPVEEGGQDERDTPFDGFDDERPDFGQAPAAEEPSRTGGWTAGWGDRPEGGEVGAGSDSTDPFPRTGSDAEPRDARDGGFDGPEPRASFAAHLDAARGGTEAADTGAAERYESGGPTGFEAPSAGFDAQGEGGVEIRVTPIEPRDAPAPAAAATPVVGPSRRRRQTGPGPLIWLLVGALLLIAAVVAAAFLRPDLFGRERAATAQAATADAGAMEEIPPPPPTPQPAGDTLPFAVQVRAYVSLDPARTQADRQARRVPETPFYVVPELTQGVLYYKVLAGLLPDTASATALRRRLVAAGVVDAQNARDESPGAWSLIQARPYAFDMGEFATREDAVTRSDSLLALQIPSYAVALPYTDGSERWRLYAGAYRDTLQAGELRRMLSDAQLPTRLVLRLGQGSPAPQ